MKYFLIIAIFCLNAEAKKPLYELGFAVGGGIVPDYPASNQSRTRYIIVPTGTYRGPIVRSDKKGTRARFIHGHRYDIDLSIGASLPANSKNNDAREGMNNLDWLGEIGPRLNFDIYDKNGSEVELELPLRFVASTDFEFTKHRGMRFNPQIDLSHRLNSKFKIYAGLKMDWATEGVTDYFYQVDGSDISAHRTGFNAKPGYIGKYISTSVSYYANHLFMILGIKYSNFEGAANENSPLYKSKENTTLFLGMNYYFYQSKKLEK
jgi:MipA family protein